MFYFTDADHWFTSAQDQLSNKLKLNRIEAQAKNLIKYIGDGMSVSTVTASRILKGQRDGVQFGEEGQLYMDTLPYVGTSKVS